MGKRYVVLERNQGSIIQDWYSCATCWTPVRVCHDENGDYISCGDDECRCNGLIKTSSINYMIQENELLAREARGLLQSQFEWLKKKKRDFISHEEILKELGY